MIQKLRTKFVMIIMSIVTLMILLIFGLVYHFTAVSLETESIRTMQNLVSSPFPKMEIPDEAPEVVRLPYFCIGAGFGQYDPCHQRRLLRYLQ